MNGRCACLQLRKEIASDAPETTIAIAVKMVRQSSGVSVGIPNLHRAQQIEPQKMGRITYAHLPIDYQLHPRDDFFAIAEDAACEDQCRTVRLHD